MYDMVFIGGICLFELILQTSSVVSFPFIDPLVPWVGQDFGNNQSELRYNRQLIDDPLHQAYDDIENYICT